MFLNIWEILTKTWIISTVGLVENSLYTWKYNSYNTFEDTDSCNIVSVGQSIWRALSLHTALLHKTTKNLVTMQVDL
jgi:hypothetical protein